MKLDFPELWLPSTNTKGILVELTPPVFAFSNGPAVLSLRGWIRLACSSSHRSMISDWTLLSMEPSARF